MNEVAAPFLLLSRDSLSKAYLLFHLFMKRHLRDFFDDEEFISLQIFLKLFDLLLQYHDPELRDFLKKNDLTPELFATPWLLTVFCSKLNINHVYLLWDLYLFENERSNLLFLSIALIRSAREKILSSDTSILPQFLTSLIFKNAEEIEPLFYDALVLKEKTPKSFLCCLSSEPSLSLLSKKKKKKKDYEKVLSNLESLEILPLDPLELMHALYKDLLKCKISCKFCNKKKRYFSYDAPSLLKPFPHLLSLLQKRTSFEKPLNYLIVDTRIERKHTGFLNKSTLVDNLTLPSCLLSKIKELKGQYHIVILGNERKNDFEKAFLKEKWEFLSCLEDFEKVHELHLAYGLEMLEHDKGKCYLCEKKQKDGFFFNVLQKLFKKDSYDSQSTPTSAALSDRGGFNQISTITTEDRFQQNLEIQKIMQEEKENNPKKNNEKTEPLTEKNLNLLKNQEKVVKETKISQKVMNYKDFIEQGVKDMPFPILKTNKENYFQQYSKNKPNDKYKKLNSNSMKINVFFKKDSKCKKQDNYEKKGIFSSILLQTWDEKNMFHKMLQSDNFSYFLCRKIKEKTKDSAYILKNNILLVTNDSLLLLKFDKNALLLLAKGKSVLAKDDFKVKIQAIFPLKTLFKISSKKFNPAILSFYYKRPTWEKLSKEFFKLEDILNEIKEKKVLRKEADFNDVLLDWHLYTNVLFFLIFCS